MRNRMFLTWHWRSKHVYSLKQTNTAAEAPIPSKPTFFNYAHTLLPTAMQAVVQDGRVQTGQDLRVLINYDTDFITGYLLTAKT